MVAGTATPVAQRPLRRGARRGVIIPLKNTETPKVEPRHIDPKAEGYSKPVPVKVEPVKVINFEEQEHAVAEVSDEQIAEMLKELIQENTSEELKEIVEVIAPAATTRQKRSVQQIVNIYSSEQEAKSWWNRLNKKQKTLVVAVVAAGTAEVIDVAHNKGFSKDLYSVKGGKWVGEKAKDGYGWVKDRFTNKPAK